MKQRIIISCVSLTHRIITAYSVADVSTGEYMVTEIENSEKLFDEIYKFMPSELICNEAFYMSGMDFELLKEKLGITVYSLDSWYFDDAVCERVLKEHFHAGTIEGLGLTDYDCGVIAAGALMQYLVGDTKTRFITHFPPDNLCFRKIYAFGTAQPDEIWSCVETLRDKQKRGSLLWVLDKTKTAMGARTLRKYIEQPLIDKSAIEKRSGCCR